jgi:glycosyltransferase involved in cell wall biosynthesis
MRVAYVIPIINKQVLEGGIGRKICHQLNLWRELGIEERLFSIASKEDDEHFYARLFDQKLFYLLKLNRVITEIKRFQPDIIYLRFGILASILQGLGLFKIAPVVLEVNTYDIVEYRLRGIFHNILNRLTRDFTFSHSNGIISVTKEIAQHKTITKYKKITTVIANGIDVSDYCFYPPPQNVNPHLLFIGVPGHAWQGIEKLFQLAEKCPDLCIDIVGYGPEDISFDVPDNIKLYGFLPRSDYLKVFAKADVGIGTLSLHRKDMEEASPLKVREYLACGLPVILPYRDTDLHELNKDYILHIPNTPNNVIANIDQIRDFSYSMMGRRIDQKIILPLIDQLHKERERKKFFRSVLTEYC